MDKIKIFALGGLDEDGKDLYCIEINGDIFVVGCGFKYPTKQTPGIDFIIADYTYLKENKDRIKAYIINKGKPNSFGALPYIYKDCPAPIYCTKIARLSIEQFAKNYKQEQDFDFHEITLPLKTDISGHPVWFFATCTSVPHSFGFSILTDIGSIVFLGDFVTEYNNSTYFNFDLNSVGKISETGTLILMCESINANKPGYCSPNNRIAPYLERYFKHASGRIFVAIAIDNLYHIEEFFKVTVQHNKKVILYDEDAATLFDMKKYRVKEEKRLTPQIVRLEEIHRYKESDIVILILGDKEKLYSKVSLLANNEHEKKILKLQSSDTFIMACPPNDNNEVIFTDTIDELYKAGCHVEYLTSKVLKTMHAFEEDIKMMISLLKPKYYFAIKGYYVNLLANAKLAFNMNVHLSHTNIFLLDNGQSINIDEKGATLDFNNDNSIPVGDLMIDGIGVGDVVNEIIQERTRLSEDGVIVLGCGVSLKSRKIVYSPDVQMRGFLFLKDKEADTMLKEVTQIYVDAIEARIQYTDGQDVNEFEKGIDQTIARYLQKQNRNPVIRSRVVIVEE